jgi:hypothetical protein
MALFGALEKNLKDGTWVAFAGPNAFCSLLPEDMTYVEGELYFEGNSSIFRAAKLMEDYAVAYMMTKSLQVFRKQLTEEQLRNMLQSVIRKFPDPNEFFTLKTKYNHSFRSGSPVILRLICVWRVGCKIGVSVAVESAPAAAAPAAAAPAAAAPAAAAPE